MISKKTSFEFSLPITTQLVRVANDNRNGTNRQVIIKKACYVGSPVYLTHAPMPSNPDNIDVFIMPGEEDAKKLYVYERDNREDKDDRSYRNSDGFYQIGNLKPTLAKEINGLLSRGETVAGSIVNIIHDEKRGTLNVDISICQTVKSKAPQLIENIIEPNYLPTKDNAPFKKPKRLLSDFVILLCLGLFLFLISLASTKEVGPTILLISIVILGISFWLRKRKTKYIATAIKNRPR